MAYLVLKSSLPLSTKKTLCVFALHPPPVLSSWAQFFPFFSPIARIGRVFCGIAKSKEENLCFQKYQPQCKEGRKYSGVKRKFIARCGRARAISFFLSLALWDVSRLESNPSYYLARCISGGFEFWLIYIEGIELLVFFKLCWALILILKDIINRT